MKTGIHEISNYDYHQDRTHISSSGLRMIHENPFNFDYFYNQDYERKTTDAMNLGSACHTFILEPDKFNKQYFMELNILDYPKALKTSDDIKAVLKENGLKVSGKKADLIERVKEIFPEIQIWDEITERYCLDNVGKKLLTDDEIATIKGISDNIKKNELAVDLLSRGKPEVSLFKDDKETKIPVKVRFDVLGDNFFVDFKTTADAKPDKFQNSLVNYGYDFQLAMYNVAAEEYFEKPFTPYILVAETKAPFNVWIKEVSGAVIDYGKRQYYDALAVLEECRFSGKYPSYQETTSELLDYPDWRVKQLEYKYGL